MSSVDGMSGSIPVVHDRVKEGERRERGRWRRWNRRGGEKRRGEEKRK